MIIQNSSDVKTEYFYDENGDISPVDAKYEKHIINPNGLVQLQKLPSQHTTFYITRKDGMNVIKYENVNTISDQTDFTTDYENGILTFHTSQMGKEVEVSYTNTIGRLAISAERVFTSIDNQGNVIKTVQEIIDNGNEALESLNVLGGASRVIQQTQANIDSVKGLVGSISNGIELKTELEKSNASAETADAILKSTIVNANDKIQEMTQWVRENGDVVNLNTRVSAAEGKLSKVDSSLEAQINNLNSTNVKIENVKLNYAGIKSELVNTKFIAHRGLSLAAPENTLLAYEMAGRLGFYGAECDISTTKDGIWVLMHDDTVDRTTDGVGLVSSKNLSEIKTLKIDAGVNIGRYPNTKVPTLEEFLVCCKMNNLVPFIEIKSAATDTEIDSFLKLIRKYNFEDRVAVISFGFAVLQKIRAKSNKIHLQLVVSTIRNEDIVLLENLGNAGFDCQYNVLLKEHIDTCHSKGVAVNSWTVNDRQIVKNLMDLGIDMITSDYVVGEV